MADKKDLKSLPKPIQKHLYTLADEQGKTEDTAYLNELAAVWISKEQLFRDQIALAELETVKKLPQKDSRGMIILTYSGSVLSMGPVFMTATNINFSRWIEYSSIKLRTEVPDIIMEKDAVLTSPVEYGKPLRFEESRLKSTSPAYYIAVCPDTMEEEEQDKRIRETSIFIATGFMKYNQALQIDPSNIPDQFTMKSMIRFIAKKHGLTGMEAKRIIDDYLTLIETGMLMGDSVPVGKLGKFSIKMKGAQKARTVKHPGTGEEMIIEAKPPRGIPKVSFSSSLKEKAEMVRLED